MPKTKPRLRKELEVIYGPVSDEAYAEILTEVRSDYMANRKPFKFRAGFEYGFETARIYYNIICRL